MNDEQIEQEIQAKGLTAPRVTPADIKAAIVQEIYFNAEEAATDAFCSSHNWRERVPDFSALKTLTFCVLVLKNGFFVVGESACASPDNFDAEIGRKIARQNAVAKIWPLMGYALRDRLSAQSA